jgi:hypothetical protein
MASLLGAMAAGASSQAGTRHPFKAEVTVEKVLSIRGAPPKPGSGATDSGPVTFVPWGKGRMHVSADFAAHPEPNIYLLHGRGTFFFAQGSVRFAYELTAHWEGHGRVLSKGTGTFTGGEGDMHAARGTFTFEGSSEVAGSPAHMHLKGVVVY